jgi:serine/threonine protein kinase
MFRKSSQAPLGQVGEYIIEDVKLGNGTTGVVMRGYHVKTKQPVAVKILTIDPKSKDGPNALKYIRSEIRILKQLSHPNVLQLLHYEQRGTQWFLVTNLAKCTLSDCIRDHLEWTETQWTPIFKQLLRALVHIHSKGVMHRDLKPANILMSDTHVIIADFGYGKEALGLDNTTVGSPYWMAPEVLLHEQYNKTVDMWSMGLIIYECVAGYPYRGVRDTTELIEAQRRPLRFDGFSDELAKLLKAMLERDPKKRINFIDLSKHCFLHDPKEKEENLDFEFINAEEFNESEAIGNRVVVLCDKIVFPNPIYELEWKATEQIEILESIEINAVRCWVIAELAHLYSLDGQYFEALALYIESVDMLHTTHLVCQTKNTDCQRMRGIKGWIRMKSAEFLENASVLKKKVKGMKSVPDQVSTTQLLFDYANNLCTIWRMDQENVIYGKRARILYGYLSTVMDLPKEMFDYVIGMSKYLNKIIP